MAIWRPLHRLSADLHDTSDVQAIDVTGFDLERRRKTTVSEDERREIECEVCGTRVPAAVYHEHLLEECPGE